MWEREVTSLRTQYVARMRNRMPDHGCSKVLLEVFGTVAISYGKRLHNDGKSRCFMGRSTKNGHLVYQKDPEGGHISKQMLLNYALLEATY